VGARFSHTCPDRPWGPPSLLYNGYQVFPGGKEWPGRDADPPPVASREKISINGSMGKRWEKYKWHSIMTAA